MLRMSSRARLPHTAGNSRFRTRLIVLSALWVAGLALVARAGAAVPEQVLVPAGTFTMGSVAGNTDERPEHSVYLDAYYVDRYEVTNAAFQAFIDAGGYANSVYWSSAGWSWRTTNNITLPLYWASGEHNSGPQNPTFPVVGVSWYEAEAFANFLCRRLPTEAEWEKAARGTDLRVYPWGATLAGSRANYLSSGDPYEPGLTPTGFYDGHVHPSPTFPTVDSPGPYGAYDQSGNAWEWAHDWYSSSYYSTSPATNPQGPASGTRRTLRGGARDTGTNDLRTFNRGDIPPTWRTATVGFRLVGPATLRGDVLGYTIRRPVENAPIERPLPDVWVTLARNGARVASPYPYPLTDPAGEFSFVSPQTCGDQLVTSLENDTIKVLLAGETPLPACAPVACIATPVIPGAEQPLRWSEVGQLDAVNAYYLAHDVLRRYWAAEMGVSIAPAIALTTGDRGEDVKRNAGALCDADGDAIAFADGMPQHEDVVFHEMAHAVLGKTIGSSIADGTRKRYAEADGLDEALADYFTAAYTGRPQIRIPGQLDRKLAPLLPVLYTHCEVEGQPGVFRYRGDAYYGARLVSAVLWELRGRFEGEGLSGGVIDRWIFDAARSFVDLRPVAERTFNNFRKVLRATGLGATRQAAIDEAFAARNIGDFPAPLCVEAPVIQNLLRSVTSTHQSVTISFTPVPRAVHYRVYLLGFGGGLGVGLGQLVADSLTATEFTYQDTDTSRVLAFHVTAVDSLGEEGPASEETPGVTGVPAGGVRDPRRSLRLSPNPSSGTVTISLSEARGWSAALSVFDVGGRILRRLTVPAGARRIQWDGRDRAGSAVPAGVYMLRLEDVLGRSTGRVAIVR